MARAAGEKKISERIGSTRTGEVQCVAVMRLQVQLNLRGFVVLVGGAGGDLLGELLDARVEVRQLQIIRGDRIRKIRGGPAQLLRRDLGKIRGGLVTNFGVVMEGIRERAGRIEDR